MNKMLAEFIGTFTLVLFGCGAAVIAGPAVGATTVGVLGISFAFGLAIVAMAYGIGGVSGCHVNPAVSVGVWIAGRMPTGEMIQYVIAQCLGAIAGTAVLYLIMSGKASGWNGGLGANGWGAGYLGEYNMTSALIFEVVATFLFLVVILGVTRAGTPLHIAGFAGMAIGLTLAAIHIVGINVTGVSVNPARSLGPALFTGGTALAQLWLFIVAPLVGAIVAGAVYRSGVLWAKE
jgi:aquaporin Z